MAQSNPTGQQRCDLLSSVYGRLPLDMRPILLEAGAAGLTASIAVFSNRSMAQSGTLSASATRKSGRSAMTAGLKPLRWWPVNRQRSFTGDDDDNKNTI